MLLPLLRTTHLVPSPPSKAEAWGRPVERLRNRPHVSFFLPPQVFALFNTVAYAGGAYCLYVDWKANPTGVGGGAAAPSPPPAV